MAKRKLTPAERAEWKAEHERVLANAHRLRALAEKAQADLDAKRSGLIGVWLDPGDVDWLATQPCPPGASDEEKARWERIRSRADAALHTAVAS